ncbi:MAG: dTDP-4-dehydrorhamnose 3,5-epimerase family protein [Solirubrobacterales bacterium]|nr:dTDP-4-dehydrorhamnose 3,5-epimerase family protein [Solirubrobacterales bacterium]
MGAGQQVTSGHKDRPHITPDWELRGERIEGVRTREVRNIVTANGLTTELFRKDWGLADEEIVAMIHVALRPGAISAWHMHKHQRDHLFAVGGTLRVVLYDGREDSSTAGRVEVIHLSPMRPTLVIVPPEVWHGIQALGNEPGSFVNFFDREYDYENTDEWRLPPDTSEIHYRFTS